MAILPGLLPLTVLQTRGTRNPYGLLRARVSTGCQDFRLRQMAQPRGWCAVQRYIPFIIFALLTVVVAWSLQRALKTGKIQDNVWHWDAERNPMMFNITFVVWCCVLVFFAAEAVHHLGLIGDPLKLLPWPLTPRTWLFSSSDMVGDAGRR